MWVELGVDKADIEKQMGWAHGGAEELLKVYGHRDKSASASGIQAKYRDNVVPLKAVDCESAREWARLFIATVWVANWLVSHYGIVDVGFGLKAPAAVFSVGVAFTLRDFVHRSLGRWYVVAGIVIGAGLSFLIAPTFALASGVAFLVSETADLTVYTPLERRSWLGAVVLSNTVGLLIDSWLFLTIAFGSLTFFWGQVVGKAWMTVLTIAVIAAVRGARALSTSVRIGLTGSGSSTCRCS
jgi:uncharacterized PurR-regulated membrane protein YhhQ (DUF165 family)